MYRISKQWTSCRVNIDLYFLLKYFFFYLFEGAEIEVDKEDRDIEGGMEGVKKGRREREKQERERGIPSIAPNSPAWTRLKREARNSVHYHVGGGTQILEALPSAS